MDNQQKIANGFCTLLSNIARKLWVSLTTFHCHVWQEHKHPKLKSLNPRCLVFNFKQKKNFQVFNNLKNLKESKAMVMMTSQSP